MGVAGAPGDDPRPYFFLSYAHIPKSDPKDANPNVWVERFYRDLCEHLMNLTSLPDGASPGFMDRQMKPGEPWPVELSKALAHCRVFVPLYAPRYFLSEQCGREWFAFSRRAAHSRALNSNNSSSASAIVPALWVPVPVKQLPRQAERLQFANEEFGEDYAAEGFYGLIKLRYLRDEYERAVYHLAKRIKEVAEMTQIADGDAEQDYHSVPTGFGPPGGKRRMDISVLACSRSELPTGRSPDCYGAHPREWNPYHPESSRPLADHAADLVRNLDYQVSVGEFEADADRMLPKGPPVTPGMLLLDHWALSTARGAELLGKLTAENRPWISVMVPWNRADPDAALQEDAMRATIQTDLAPRPGDEGGHCSPSGGVPTLQAFSQELPVAVKAAARHYDRHAQTYPPDGGGGSKPQVLPSGVGYGSGIPARETKSNAEKAEGSLRDREP
ncbi:TIR domain-containing protein [Streptomyces beijiangensis]|uniref:TIR domain-containing protein n=1 Tax=Streptomyces beijiangensis TaxID=163361 RepID=A0A939F2L3_9ACTN|nr:TIR domain-containing protein [Streptomyces beijiangensis]